MTLFKPLKPLFALSLFGLLLFVSDCLPTAADPLDAARKNTVLVIAQLQTGNQLVSETGSGFFLDSTHVATCFHVVFSVAPSAKPNSTDITPAKHILVTLSDGETIPVDTETAPTELDRAPLDDDFAILKLKSTPKITIIPSPLAADGKSIPVGSPISFSGYPLVEQYPLFVADHPEFAFLHTFVGTISGQSADGQLLGLEAPVNHGSSGSALLNAQGEVIGIVSYEHSNFDLIYKQAMNTPIEADKLSPPELKAVLLSLKLLQQLSRSSSNGLGYARSITALKAYLMRHPEVMKN